MLWINFRREVSASGAMTMGERFACLLMGKDRSIDSGGHVHLLSSEVKPLSLKVRLQLTFMSVLFCDF